MNLQEKYKIDWCVETLSGQKVYYEDLVKEVYPDVNWFFDQYEGSYQGDFYMLGKKDDEYYFFTMNYGSCSGCDWLESIRDYEELQKLIDAIPENVQIKNRKDMVDYVAKYDFDKYVSDDERVEKKMRGALDAN